MMWVELSTTPKGPKKEPIQVVRLAASVERKDSGISSASPFLLGSWVLKARSTSVNSSMVVGISRPRFFSQVMFMPSTPATCVDKLSSMAGMP